ncbi:MAG: kynureninase [Clostridiales bacterium]|nr:kynureninase [Clostridiales bacterium]
MFRTDENFALEMDSKDKLKKFKERFYIQKDTIYMDGNSLGMMSKDAEEALMRLVNEWKTLGINGWMGGKIPWFYYAEELSKKMSSLMGASPEEVIIHGSTTINLHIGLSTFYRPKENKYKILMDELNFPSDIYAVESQIKAKGLKPDDVLVLVKSRDGKTLEEEDIIEMMTDEVAVALLPGVLYRSGQLIDMERITKAAHEKGIYVIFDLSHSAGAIKHELSKWNVDFAFWCGYKYLSNGPGGSASFFINKKHFEKETGLAGWFGYRKDKQFDMDLEFKQAKNAGGFQIGTPHIFSMAPLEGTLNIFEEAGIDNMREKSLKATDYMMYLIDSKLAKFGFNIGTPREHSRRGGHVALEHDEAIRINEAMKERGIIPDFRYPNVIRLAPIALYISFHDIWKMVEIIEDIMINKEYEKFSKERSTVA